LVIRAGKEETSIDRPGIVHRLDKETSGVMIVAKHQKAHEFLKKQFQDRLAQKTYWAVVWGNFTEDSGSVDAPIGKSRNDFRQWQAGGNARGLLRDAHTDFRVLKRMQENGEHFCLCEVRPKTGRTHQIRVHMKYLHHPLVGDSLYAPSRPLVLGFTRLALHAFRLSIGLPSGENRVFEAGPEEVFQKLAK
jgi:23S rRNA pseudouridine1911/1915/1917 synthase